MVDKVAWEEDALGGGCSGWCMVVNATYILPEGLNRYRYQKRFLINVGDPDLMSYSLSRSRSKARKW